MACDVRTEDSFLTQLERARVELREKVARAHQMLQERETALLSELQQLEDTYRGEGVDTQIDQLRITKEQTIATLTDNKNKEFLEQNVALLNTQMRELAANGETARDRMRSVELEWDGNLERILDGTGSIRVAGYNEEEYTHKRIKTKEQVIRPITDGKLIDNPCFTNSGVKKGFPIKGEKHTATQPLRPRHIETPSITITQPIDNDYGVRSKPLSPTTKQNTFAHNQRTIKYSDKIDKFVSNNTPIYQSNGNNQKLSSTTHISKSTASSQETNKYNPDTTTVPSSVRDSSYNRSGNLTNKQKHSPPYASDWDDKNSRDVITIINQSGAHYKPQEATEGKPIRGLKNLGNTCFMNCILQCLSHTLPLRQLYVSDEYKQCLRSRRGDLSYIFKRVMLELWDTTHRDSVAPYELKRQVGIVAPRFSGYNQHDAQEFMRFLLNELHDEINRASVKGRKPPADNETLQVAVKRYQTWEDSRIYELFGGMLRSEVCCSACGNKFRPFMDLALPIPKIKISYPRPTHSYSFSYDVSQEPAVKLAECLEMFTAVEKLDEEERPYCAKCKKLTASSKQLSIAMLPRYLVIQLKRFSGYTVRTKLSTPVSFEDTWSLEGSGGKNQNYSLYGIVSHSGGHPFGHYVAYCWHNKVWRCFNDTMARDVSWEHVRHQEAYILFYEKED